MRKYTLDFALIDNTTYTGKVLTSPTKYNKSEDLFNMSEMSKDKSRSVPLKNRVPEFLQKLRKGSARDVKNLLECLGNVELTIILQSVELLIEDLSDERMRHCMS